MPRFRRFRGRSRRRRSRRRGGIRKRGFSMRRVLSRYKRLKPELKYVELQNSVTIPGTGFVTGNLNNSNVLQGADVDQRNGQQIFFNKITFHSTFVMTTFPASTLPDIAIRFILWTPRLDSTAALTYMSSLNDITPLDFNVVTIHMDRWIRLGQITTAAVGLLVGALVPNVRPSHTTLNKTIKFPRRVKFLRGSTAINPDKDILYYTIVNRYTRPIVWDYHSRCTFIDV